MMEPPTNQTDTLKVSNSFAREYLRRSEGVKLKPTTVRTYDTHLNQYLTFLHDRERTVLEAEFNDVVGFLEQCVRANNRQSTLNGKLTAIAELYRYIRLRTDAKEELQLDPVRFREIDLSEYNTPEKIEREALSREEIRRLFDAFNSYRNRLMAIVGVETGIRNSDIRCMRLRDIEDETIHIPDPKNSKPYDVPISDQLAFELDWWSRNQRKGYAASQESEFVFPSQQGEKLERNGSLNNIIRDAAERAGVQEVIGRTQLSDNRRAELNTNKEYLEWHRVTVHTLRHSFVTLLEESGVSLPYRQLVANHTDPETTKGYSKNGSDVVFNLIRDKYDVPR